MGRLITPTNHPHIRVIAIDGELTYSDMTCDAELDLNQGFPVWVLLDISELSVALPNNFLDGARHSFFINPNLQHLSIYCKSSLLRNIAIMVAKLTRRKESLSVHDTFEKAMAHLQMLAK